MQNALYQLLCLNVKNESPFYQRFLFQILFHYKIMFLTSSVEGAITKNKVTSFTHEFY